MKILQRFKNTTALMVILAFVLGWQLGHVDVKLEWSQYKPKLEIVNQSPPQESQKIDFKLFWDTWDLLTSEYFDKKSIDPKKMYYGAISGMVSSLGDPYTFFLPPELQKSTKEELGGSFEGVGIQLGFNKEKRLVIITPLKDTPAEKAGVKAGDTILKIGGKDSINMTLQEAVVLIRGPKGTQVDLEIFREGEEKAKTIALTRDTIVVKSVELEEKKTKSGKKIAYIKLSRFGERTFEEWDKVVSGVLSMNPEGVILDIRNNPGGFLEGAEYIGSEFIKNGDVYQKEDSSGKRTGFGVRKTGKITDVELVVLINKGSASAAEIVAGAIQDHKRGKIVGEQSFGKGTIQTSQDLAESTGIHITIEKWLTPNGRWVHETGLSPDLPVEQINGDQDKEEKDEQFEKALDLLN